VILATREGRAAITAERRAADWSGLAPSRSSVGSLGMAGVPFGAAIPAVACAVRLVSETIATFPLRVYTGSATERQPVWDAWQADLFQDPDPSTSLSSFEFWEDVVTSIELFRGGFVYKHIARGRVQALQILDPDYVAVIEHRDKSVTIWAWVNGQREDITSRVVHVRGWAPVPAAAEGIGTTQLHRDSIRGAQDYEAYRGRYFANDATPGLILTHPGQPTKEQRVDLLRAWMQRHQGPDKRSLPGMLWGGMTAQQMQTSMKDSQGTELADAIVRDVAREFRIYPAALLHAAVDSNAGLTSTEMTANMFLRFSLRGRLQRIARAFAADRDLFPDRRYYPRFDTGEFQLGDIQTMADRAHKLVQVGLMTPNEGRAENGLPPHPDGDTLQATPVGGAPNPTPPAT
jgi:HK97 family phage portal protein